MEIELRFFATFREAAGSKTHTRSIDEDATVGDVLGALEDEYDGLDGRLLTEDGDAVRAQLSVLKNGRNVVHMDGPATELESGDVLSVFPPVAGGCQ